MLPSMQDPNLPDQGSDSRTLPWKCSPNHSTTVEVLSFSWTHSRCHWGLSRLLSLWFWCICSWASADFRICLWFQKIFPIQLSKLVFLPGLMALIYNFLALLLLLLTMTSHPHPFLLTPGSLYLWAAILAALMQWPWLSPMLAMPFLV